ncbi:DNA-3-methyladenine glycosylase I [Sphingomonas sp. MG17]|uniref:DNA-3-methyladenine glycosylase I n=1 Tax=Sphingomonas tagetis TaxID=2949092 RepID=A0A9X2HKY8_9SPHN|nr:DNA-3-methyladenine glycosylase I [Sphingomonas tagetis]MCP3729123.1 DNA-3-methyladenine glycosylase I [Sphingomonas tagetis]
MMERTRCGWANGDALMADYHDREWGVPVHDSRRLWEILMLEGMQAGLSWSIILKRREGFHAAFAGGAPVKGDGMNVPASTAVSEALSKALKGKGFKFVGPVIVYAWMQAVGMVNDHAAGCFRREAV